MHRVTIFTTTTTVTVSTHSAQSYHLHNHHHCNCQHTQCTELPSSQQTLQLSAHVVDTLMELSEQNKTKTNKKVRPDLFRSTSKGSNSCCRLHLTTRMGYLLYQAANRSCPPLALAKRIQNTRTLLVWVIVTWQWQRNTSKAVSPQFSFRHKTSHACILLATAANLSLLHASGDKAVFSSLTY